MIKSVLFVHEVPIKDVKANLLQTLNMCQAFSMKGTNVKLLILTQVSRVKAKQIVEGIIPDYNELFVVEFLIYKPSLSFFSSLDRFLSLRKYIDHSYQYIFTRSPLVSIYSINKVDNLIYEAHNAYFTKQKYLDVYYRRKFKKIIKKDSFKMFLSISNNLKNYWIENGILDSKSIALHDGTSTDFKIVEPKLSFPFKINGRLKVTYTGSLYEDRGIVRILKLAKDFDVFDFLVIGGPKNNAENYRKIAETRGLSNIKFIGPVDHKEIPYYLSRSDVLLALWSRSVPTIEYCSPLKVFEYLNSNKLIVADGYTTIKEVLTHNDNAILCEPDNYESLKNALRRIAKDPSLLGLGIGNNNLIKSKYSWDRRVDIIIEKLEKNA